MWYITNIYQPLQYSRILTDSRSDILHIPPAEFSSFCNIFNFLLHHRTIQHLANAARGRSVSAKMGVMFTLQQETTIRSAHSGKHVFTLPLTGFGKSLMIEHHCSDGHWLLPSAPIGSLQLLPPDNAIDIEWTMFPLFSFTSLCVHFQQVSGFKLLFLLLLLSHPNFKD